MRLVCPNCDAKYEVPDDAVPEDGRDVQCSACGHGWFQKRPEDEAAAEEEAALFGDALATAAEPPGEEAAVADSGDAPAEAAEPDATPVEPPPPPEPAEVGDPPDETAVAVARIVSAAAAEDAAKDSAPAKQDLDDGVKAVLREEAEREAASRRAETRRGDAQRADAEGQMQVQPELGVAAAAPALSPLQRRLAMLQGKDPSPPPPEPPRPAARRDLLPDVEEINSTLRPAATLAELDAEVESLPDLTRGRSSFRSGFLLVLLLLILAMAVYVTAPRLAAQFPRLEAPLASYVAFVDGLRIWLSDAVNNAAASLGSAKPD